MKLFRFKFQDIPSTSESSDNDNIPDIGLLNHTTTSHEELALMKDCYQTIV